MITGINEEQESYMQHAILPRVPVYKQGRAL